MSPAEIRALLDPGECAALAAAVGDHDAGLGAVTSLKRRVAGPEAAGDAFERAFLCAAATVFEPRIAAVRAHASVLLRLREEFRFYTLPTGRESLAAGTYLFTTGCKMISLRRYPAGPMDFEISGVPRSWLPRIPPVDWLRSGLFITRRLKSLYPLFFLHVARRPKNRSLLIRKEVQRMYYRAARSLELQPEVYGIMASAWFHDPAAVAADPHLACLSTPYLENGGLITNTGPASEDAGFLERNAARKEQLDAGLLHYKLGLALWPREAAIDWAARNPELEDPA